MKKFLVRGAFILIPLLAFLGFLEWQLRKIPNDYAYKRAYLDRHASEIEVLILGSSLSWSGLDPSLFRDNCYNAAFQGQTLHYDKLIFEKYKRDWKSLQDVVLTVFYPTMEYRMSEVAEVREANYSVYFDAFPPRLIFPNYNGVQIQQMFRRYWQDPSSLVESDSLGFGLKDRITPETQSEQAKRLAQQHTRSSPKHRKFNRTQLKKLAVECNKIGVDLWIIVHPAQKNYRDHINHEQMEFLLEACQEVSGNHPNVHYINYFDNERFRPEFFNDGIHLNRQGADLLSHLADSLIQSN